MAVENHQVSPLTWHEFERVEMYVGTIVLAQEFPAARKPAYQLTIDFGPLGIRKSSAQITQMYQTQELIGSKVIAVLNFPPKQIANFISECLVLGSTNQLGQVRLLRPDEGAQNGERIS
jgi:tRNA-binding protein